MGRGWALVRRAGVAVGAARAQQLVLTAADLGHPHGLRLSAGTEDRYLVKTGQRQRYGSQLACTPGEGWHVAPVDPSVDDAARTARGTEPLAAMEARTARLNVALAGRCRLNAAGMRVLAGITNAARRG